MTNVQSKFWGFFFFTFLLLCLFCFVLFFPLFYSSFIDFSSSSFQNLRKKRKENIKFILLSTSRKYVQQSTFFFSPRKSRPKGNQENGLKIFFRGKERNRWKRKERRRRKNVVEMSWSASFATYFKEMFDDWGKKWYPIFWSTRPDTRKSMQHKGTM